MSYSLLLLSLPSILLSSSLLFLPRCHSPAPPPPHYRHPALVAPPALSPVVAVFDRNSISTGPPLSPTLSPVLHLLLYISYGTPPHYSRGPQHPGKEATGCIPRDKLRGSIIHGNLQAPLFKRLPIPPVRRRYPARHDVNTKTGDFK